MTKVTSSETIHFPSLNWGITKGEVKELPEALKDNQEVILAHPSITAVGDEKESAKENKKDEHKK